ncbi:DUF2269 domain-containing protein [Actinoplanes sp. ATCC 53533]|uniref:DUF2269 domain-containing protein n=1 Tax=Actinoplanes sp. ATCC 53533 TaxID=1288362 RepID=UPI000F774D92|nr:DUF2269 domain-containing protein [Actinoplanes sp. ATCC 53533]RSM62047.1 DUF2269 domain-containing protein [Actinoplanes sp. ATCC 53533]
MTMPPRLRKVVLTAHVTTSVGWLGAILAYLAVDITAVTSQDIQTVRGAYATMEVIVTSVIVPLALASVLIGIVNALGTPWGLLRHYWVLAKLLLTAFAAAVLLLETQTVTHLATTAATSADPRGLPGTLPHSAGGLVLLLIAVTLSVFKPQGVTRYGWRRRNELRRDKRALRTAPMA